MGSGENPIISKARTGLNQPVSPFVCGLVSTIRPVRYAFVCEKHQPAGDNANRPGDQCIVGDRKTVRKRNMTWLFSFIPVSRARACQPNCTAHAS
jgi:hypothetical protein